MFESIGRVQDTEARRRRIKAFAITGGIAAIGFVVGVLITPPPAPTALPAPEKRIVCLVGCDEIDDPMKDEVVPEPPAKRAGDEGGGEPDPEDVSRSYELPTPSTVVRTKTESGKGKKAGPGTGKGGTKLGPGCDGDDCGNGDGDGAVHVHASKLEILDQVDPRYPREAKRMGLGQERCEARLRIDERGEVYEVEVSKCNPAFHRATRDALMQWRFEPMRTLQGDRIEARTIVGVTFK